ncbi:MAG: DUF1611 domain-containing protein, partial [Brachybacterium tyrofermentans]
MTILNHESATETTSAPAPRTSTSTTTTPSASTRPRTSTTASPRTPRARPTHAFSTRNVGAFLRRAQGIDLLTEGHTPQAGEVVLARVTSIGHHKRLESPVSRRQILFPGDEIVVAYGSRYAADQFLALVPEDLGPLHLAAAGG